MLFSRTLANCVQIFMDGTFLSSQRNLVSRVPCNFDRISRYSHVHFTVVSSILTLNLAQTWLLSIKKVSASREVSLEVSRLIKEDIVVVVDWLLKVKVAYQCSSFLLSHPKVP